MFYSKRCAADKARSSLKRRTQFRLNRRRTHLTCTSRTSTDYYCNTSLACEEQIHPSTHPFIHPRGVKSTPPQECSKGMEDRRHLPPDGGGNLKRSAPAECGTEERAVSKERGDPERKDNLCDVPRKVPRFQYVDFPSLHQCIQQLSVPPLNGWLGSCSMAKAPNYRPASPKEKVPKFKYVDYPSLHHCIQQLSVPPLESWSAGLVRLNAEGGQQRPLQAGTVRKNQRNDGGDQNTKQNMSRGTAFTFERDTLSSVSSREEAQQRLEKGKPEAGLRSEYSCRFESGSGSQTNTAVMRNVRPSVISMVHTDKQKHWTKPDHLEERLNSPDSVGRVPWSTLPESVCPFCQQMFTNPEQFRAHQRSHRDKRPN